MVLNEVITKDDFAALWNIDPDYDLTQIANEFYDFYNEEELINSNVKLRFNIKCIPHIKNLIYDMKRWKTLMGYTPEDITTSTQNNTSNSRDTSNRTSTQRDNEGYAGYGSTNQNSKFVANETSITDNNTNTNDTSNNSTTSLKGTNIKDMNEWLNTNFKNIYYTYYLQIRDELFIGEW